MATALIVDSNLARSRPLTDALKTAGFGSVFYARSSGEGLLMARSIKPDFAVVSQDIETQNAGHKLIAELERTGVSCLLTASLVKVSDDALSSSDYSGIAERAKSHRCAARAADEDPTTADIRWDFHSKPQFRDWAWD